MKDPSGKELLRHFHVFSHAVQGVLQNSVAASVSGGALSFRQVSLLVLVSSKGGHLVGDVVHFLGVSYAAASQTVDKLVKTGYVTLESDPRDRRVKRINATEKGADVARRFQEEQTRRLERVLREYSPEMLQSFSTSLADTATLLLATGQEEGEKTCLQCGIFDLRGCVLDGETEATCPYQDHWDEHAEPPPPGGAIK